MIYIKNCLFCGSTFQTRYKKKKFCNGDHHITCPVCGNIVKIDNTRIDYIYRRKLRGIACCSDRCSKILSHKLRSKEEKDSIQQKRNKTNLERYGKIGFVNPEKSRQTKDYRYGNPNYNNRIKAKNTCIQRYNVDNPAKISKNIDKQRYTKLIRYGDKNYNNRDKASKTNISRYNYPDAMQSDEIKQRLRNSNIKKYGVPYTLQLKKFKDSRIYTNISNYGVPYITQVPEIVDKIKETQFSRYGSWYSSTEEGKSRRRETSYMKYGVSNPSKSSDIKTKIKRTNLLRYGVEYPSQDPNIRRKQIANSKDSRFELRIVNMLNTYDINFRRQYILRDEVNNLIHSFDFYIPQYKILIDADGVYWHSYLSDPDGKHVRDDYDSVRLSLIPKDHIFILIVEGREERAIKELRDTLKRIDKGIFDYDSELFRWCRSVGFPYPNYSEKRMLNDWNSLCKYQKDTYIPNCRFGNSIIKQFHRSFYDCKVGVNSKSPKEAWEDDDIIKEVIANRLIYKNDVDPNKVMQGFAITKKCPQVSTFNPVLAKYLTNKYLKEYNTIFDPFSGFSGRLLGVCSTGKNYIGHDLNTKAVKESNEIIQFLHLEDKADISECDIFDFKGSFDCLLTCPPYGTKEIYNKETVFKSCDEWIDICLERYQCNRYVFVVDQTEKYKHHVIEELTSRSHFHTVSEYIIVID